MAPSRPLAALLALFALPLIAEGKHFRYGTVRWRPTEQTTAPGPGLKPYEAEFQMQLAYRRAYDWGAYFKEQWRNTRDPEDSGWKAELGLGATYLPCSKDGIAPNPNIQCFDSSDTPEAYAQYYQIKFRAGMGAEGHDLAGPTADGGDYYVFPADDDSGATGKQVNGTSDDQNKGGEVCRCRFHKGVEGANIACPSVFHNLGGGMTVRDSKEPICLEPEVCGGGTREVGQMLANQPGAAPQFYLGKLTGVENRVKVCTPWSEVYGFFYGDDKWNNDGVIVDVTYVDTEDTLAGNFIRGTSEPFTHEYGSTGPFVAFFTGGNRIASLNNNMRGRFRLETTVKFVANDIENRSPVAYQIPLLPVPYNADGVRFQIPAYDPDDDNVRFFLAGQEEMGGLLANMDFLGNYAWHRDVYTYSICSQSAGSIEICTEKVWWPASDAAAAEDYKNTYPILPSWNPNTSLPTQPLDLTIDENTGIVTWLTGPDMTTGKQAGFYNLVVMIQEKKDGVSHVAETRTPDAVMVPLDFLIYLYPSMHFCNMACLNDETAPGPTLSTFESRDGFYGVAGGSPVFAGDNTGLCKICGGGGSYNMTGATDADREEEVKYNPTAYNNGTTYCKVRGEATEIAITDGIRECCMDGITAAAAYEEYGRGDDPEFGSEWFERDPPRVNRTNRAPFDRETNPPNRGFQGCFGYGVDGADSDTIVPYSGEFDVCNQNQPPYFITEKTFPVGNTPDLVDGNIEKGTPFNDAYPPSTAKVPAELGKPVEFQLQAFDPDACVEISIMDTGMLTNMKLGPPERAATVGVQGLPTAQSVSRNFTWNPYNLTGAPGNLTINEHDSWVHDDREKFSVTCFYATDQYMLTSYPYHCVEIKLVQTTTVEWCEPEIDPGYVIPKRTYFGRPFAIDLCVRKAPVNNNTGKVIGAYNIDVREVTSDMRDGVYPNTSNTLADTWQRFSTVNFPASASFSTTQNALDPKDPYHAQWLFSPEEGEECAFTVCFEGYDRDSPSEVTDTARCWLIEVINAVLNFYGDDDPAEVYSVSSMIPDNQGYTVSAWFNPNDCPTCPANETLFSFVSTRHIAETYGTQKDTGLSIRSSVFWTEKGEGIGAVGYYDHFRGGVVTEATFRADLWHYVALTVDADGVGTLYVDGAVAQFDQPTQLDESLYAVAKFSTRSRPDNTVYYDPADVDRSTPLYHGKMKLGEGYRGRLDEVRVWGKSLTAAEVDADMFTRAVTVGEDGVVLALTMTPATPDDPIPTNPATPAMVASWPDFLGKRASGSGNAFDSYGLPYPGMTPCSMSLYGQVIGPTAGGCTITVGTFNIAVSTRPACKFGDTVVRAEQNYPSYLLCESPPGMAPGYVPVTVSNDGVKFTDPVKVGKSVDYLFMESVMYLDGTPASGADLTEVCEDLVANEEAEEPDQSVTFGGWFCPNCGPPEGAGMR